MRTHYPLFSDFISIFAVGIHSYNEQPRGCSASVFRFRHISNLKCAVFSQSDNAGSVFRNLDISLPGFSDSGAVCLPEEDSSDLSSFICRGLFFRHFHRYPYCLGLCSASESSSALSVFRHRIRDHCFWYCGIKQMPDAADPDGPVSA